METILTIVLLIFGVLQIILFFKLWGMTNRVKDIYDEISGSNHFGDGWAFDYLVWYCEEEIRKAKRMIAIEDDSAYKKLKGLIYDIESLDGKISSDAMKKLENYIGEANDLLSGIKK